MKVSVFGRPDGSPASHPNDLLFPGGWSRRAGMMALALAGSSYAAVHLPFLAPSLEDYDSINFALGLRDFDPARHQPHPPGSPVYIAIGRMLLGLVSAASPALSPTQHEALTLALLSAVGAGVAIVAVGVVFASIAPRHGSHALWAAALVAVCPLFWMTGLRPMSDLPGLAAALVAQALILRGRSQARALVAGALVAALAAGMRVQTVWLTMPLLGVVLFGWRSAGIAWLLSRPGAALAAGVLAWAVPLVADSGGVAGYLSALGSQAGEDFAWVNMLWLEPTPRKLAFTLYETFVMPWAFVPLAASIGAVAVIGAISLLVRGRRELGLLLVAFAPYALFHLLFQETVTLRYALPTVPLVAWLAIRGLALSGRLMPLGAMAVVIASATVAFPAGVAYGSASHPAFQAIEDASRTAATAPVAAVFSHHSVWRALEAESGGLPLVAPPRMYEWLGPVEYWKKGGDAPVWFLADPRRTDLALIDPQARQDRVEYRWPAASRPELSGTRPLGTDWYRIPPPSWFAGEGWSLTPETGGLARATGRGPDDRPIEAWVRRRTEPMHLLVGGRHLGEPGDPTAAFELRVDGTLRDQWSVTVDERNFLRFLDIPDGLGGEGRYAHLTIASRPVTGETRRAPVGVRQFDIQPRTQMLFAFGEGWHEDEYDVATGLRWRWTSDRSVIQVKDAPGAVEITLKGESPLRYFDGAPVVRVTAASRVIGELRPSTDFEWTVIVPADDVARSEGRIAIETDRVYLPGQVEGTSDARRLGLRIYECRVYPVFH